MNSARSTVIIVRSSFAFVVAEHEDAPAAVPRRLHDDGLDGADELFEGYVQGDLLCRPLPLEALPGSEIPPAPQRPLASDELTWCSTARPSPNGAHVHCSRVSHAAPGFASTGRQKPWRSSNSSCVTSIRCSGSPACPGGHKLLQMIAMNDVHHRERLAQMHAARTHTDDRYLARRRCFFFLRGCGVVRVSVNTRGPCAIVCDLFIYFLFSFIELIIKVSSITHDEETVIAS